MFKKEEKSLILINQTEKLMKPALDAFFNIGSTEETNSEFAFDICVCRFCFVFGQIWSI